MPEDVRCKVFDCALVVDAGAEPDDGLFAFVTDAGDNPPFYFHHIVKLGIRTEMSGLKLCEALASTCRLRRSLDGCLKFWRSGRSRRVQSQAEKKLKGGKSKLREVGC